MISANKRQRTFLNEYEGFKPTTENNKVSNIDLSQILKQRNPSEWFFDNYISLKKPVLINGVIQDFDVKSFKLDEILNTLAYKDGSYDIVQVEKKIDGGFGSGSLRENMPFNIFINKIKEGKTDGYLTTQYENEEDIDDHESEEEDNEDSAVALQIKQAIDSKANADLLDDESDIDSIDFNDIHDDFDELEENDIDVDEDEIPVVSFSDDEEQEPMYEDEAMERLHNLIQKPLLPNIEKKNRIPLIPSFLESLIPQQINLWIGSSKPTSDDIGEEGEFDGERLLKKLGKRIPGNLGTSSGLHHDHANNLYIPVQGSKRFTIFSPSEASNLYTVGDIEHIYSSGVIDYKVNENAPNWKHIRSDGATIDDDDDDDIGSIDAEIENLEKPKNKKLDPPSFSKIPPFLIHLNDVKSCELRQNLIKFKNNKFPKSESSISMEVELKPGQMLYLPTGWFHEVSSYGNVHIALNYWFYPDDGETYEKPYLNDFWSKDYKRTEKAVEFYEKSQQSS